MLQHLSIVKLSALIFLQVLDVISTVIFLKLGLQEANWLFNTAEHPVQRMIVAKTLLMCYLIGISYLGYRTKNII